LSSLYWLQLALIKMKTAIQLKKFTYLLYISIWFVYCVISIVIPVLIWRRLAKLNSILDLILANIDYTNRKKLKRAETFLSMIFLVLVIISIPLIVIIRYTAPWEDFLLNYLIDNKLPTLWLCIIDGTIYSIFVFGVISRVVFSYTY